MGFNGSNVHGEKEDIVSDQICEIRGTIGKKKKNFEFLTGYVFDNSTYRND